MKTIMINQTAWTERKFDFNFPLELFPVIVERLRGALPQIEAMVKNISDETLSHKKEGKWSVKEIIGHLYDLEELWLGRIEDFLAKKETLRAADMSNTKTKAANHNVKPVDTLINQFTEARQLLIKRVEGFDTSTVSLTALHPRLQKPMRLVDSLYFAAEHDDHELTKIRSLLID